jgi:hypothetical protein
MRYVVVKTRFRGMSPGFPPNFGGDYGNVTVIVFTALAWPLLLGHTSVLAFRGRSLHITKLKNKPIKEGYKVWLFANHEYA